MTKIIILSSAFFTFSFAEGSWMESWITPDPGIFLWTLIAFFIVLGILKWKAWGPLMNTLDKREEDIKNALLAADRAKEDAEKASQDYEELVTKAHTEAQQIIANSKLAGEKVKNDIESIAKENAEEMVKKAKIRKAVALSSFVIIATSLALSGRVDFPTHSKIDKAFFMEPLK